MPGEDRAGTRQERNVELGPQHAIFIVLLVGISLRMSLRLLYGARGPRMGDPVFLMINTAVGY